MRKIAFLMMLTFCITFVHAQVAISTDNSAPDATAMLDIKSIAKGVLIPRVTTAQRTTIGSPGFPADGLLVYDTDTKSFWYYKNGADWQQISTGLVLPYSSTASSSTDLFAITNQGTGAGVTGINSSANTFAYGVTGIISSTAPGGFSSAVRGINNGTAGLGIGVYGSQAGSGWGVYGTSVSGNGVYGFSTSGIGINGFSTTSNAAYFTNTSSSSADAVVIENSGTGDGLSISSSNSSNAAKGINVTRSGTGTGISSSTSGTGAAGHFENTNAANTSSTIEVATGGIGSGLSISLTNASNGARGIDVLQAGVGPGVFAASTGGIALWGITSSISAAGVIGDNTFGEAVVGRNRGGNGVGAVVGRNDSSGYGVRGFNTRDGYGVLGQAGISGGTGIGGRFENVNAANTSNALEASTNGNGTAFMANHSGSSGNVAVFKSSSANVARIDKTGKGFFNGGTQTSGADVAEAFDVEGKITEYEPGDVLVISESKDRTVEKSTGSYSSLAAGVYATRPGVLLTPESIDSDLAGKVPMGVIGVIPTKVCNENGAVKRGDLLVTASRSGYAMKADIDKVKPGQIIGKALETLEAATGKILVLVSIK